MSTSSASQYPQMKAEIAAAPGRWINRAGDDGVWMVKHLQSQRFTRGVVRRLATQTQSATPGADVLAKGARNAS